MVTPPSTIGELLDSADAARASGRGDVAGRLYNEAASRCRNANDLDGWTRAVLGAASSYVFGVEPGKLPAQLYDVLARTTDPATRARLGAALARCWAYSGQSRRSAQFADEALALAQRAGAPELVADCLDAALAAHWGPDELEIRRGLASKLDDVTAHVLDPDVRLQAHLWSLQVACEALDLPSMHRQMRALEILGEESARARFFAASRRLMLDLLRGRTDTSSGLIRVAAEAAEQAALPDAWMVLKAMHAYTAAQSGDTAGCAAAAAEMESFALAEGAVTICAEAAFVWVFAAEPDRVRLLVNTFRGRVLDDLPRDVNFLLTLQCVMEAALDVGDRELVDNAARLLTPYAGRAVFNAGAVMFHGLTDDTLARAAEVLGDPVTAGRLRTSALRSYEHLGAQWWRDRLGRWQPSAESTEPQPESSPIHLHPAPGGLWLIGTGERATPLRVMRGFGYLRELLRRPGRSVAALDLVAGGTGMAVQSGIDGFLDKQAVENYRRRLRDIDLELAEAQEWSDLGRLDAIHAEREALLAELRPSTGLHGRSRLTGSSQERARVAVKKAISTAMERIAGVDPPLARHLQASIHTGLNCSYLPSPDEEPRVWMLD